MNAGFKFAFWCASISATCFVLAALENWTGIVSWLAPTEVHLFAWLGIIAVCTIIVRSFRREGIGPRLPELKAMIAGWVLPRPRHRRYAKRTRRVVP